MTPEQASFLLNTVYLPQIQSEYQTTRKVIQAVPADKTGWKPDPKSMAALELASHIASSDCFFMHGMCDGHFNPAAYAVPDTVKTPAELLKWYDENFAKAQARFQKMTPDELAKSIDFFGVMVQPAITYAAFM